MNPFCVFAAALDVLQEERCKRATRFAINIHHWRRFPLSRSICADKSGSVREKGARRGLRGDIDIGVLLKCIAVPMSWHGGLGR